MDQEIKHRYPVIRKYWFIIPLLSLTMYLAIRGFSAWQSVEYVAQKDSMTFGDVTEGTFNDYLRISARVESGTVVMIAALESGIVDRICAEEGSMVKAGEVIVSLRNPGLRQQILDSESQLAERQNMLRDTELTMEREGLQLKRDLLAARTELSRRQREAERLTALYAEQLCPREDYLKGSEELELARASLRLIENRLTQDSVYRSVQLSMMRESLANMQENLGLVRTRADNLDIRATHGGQLSRLDAGLGQSISAGTQVGQINILDRYKLTAYIDEFYIDRVVPGLAGTVDKGNIRYGVEVRKVYPEIKDGQFRVDLEFGDTLPENIRIGQSYIVDIQTGHPGQAVMVPRGTFFHSTGGQYVYVVSPDGRSAVRRDVRIGRQNPAYYEVTAGLVPGEKIITSSYAEFGDADRIRIK